MDRIEEIKTIIEYNSKMMSKYNQRIQELKVELDKIDSQIKWVPVAELDEKEEKDAWCLRHFLLPSDAADLARGSRVIELENKRKPIQNELDALIV